MTKARKPVFRAFVLVLILMGWVGAARAQTYTGDGLAPFPDPKPAKRAADLKRQEQGAIPKGEPPAVRTPVHDSLDILKKDVDTKYASCSDAKVAKLVGMPKDKALAEVRKMHVLAFRMLDPLSSVTYEVSPNRLTLVVPPDGIVSRSFCR